MAIFVQLLSCLCQDPVARYDVRMRQVKEEIHLVCKNTKAINQNATPGNSFVVGIVPVMPFQSPLYM